MVIESPTYPDLRDILLQRTKSITGLPVDSEGLILDEDVLRHADSVFITPIPSMPNNAYHVGNQASAIAGYGARMIY